ncbi:MAG: hypothetical protein WC565_03190 [Parcubacteria group bacterium]|jgi:hypothetical protein
MVYTEEIEIGQVGSGASTYITTLTVTSREEEVTPVDEPAELGEMYTLPEQVPFLGISERGYTPADKVIATATDLISVYRAFDRCLPAASLYSSLGQDRVDTCTRVLERIGLVVDDGRGFKCNRKASQELVDQVRDLCVS